MVSKSDLLDWVYEAVKDGGGKSKLVQVAEHIWENHEEDLRKSGDLFFTWQYDMRWAAQYLRDSGKFRPANVCSRGYWEMAT